MAVHYTSSCSALLLGIYRSPFLGIKDACRNPLSIFLRFASKKTSGSTRNQRRDRRPKHRGWRVQDGKFVQTGTLLVVQRNLRFHPGLNVGIGRNGTLYAMEKGHVMVTCEKFDPNWDHSWVKRIYGGRENENIYKKYFNVITEPQHNRFVLTDSV